MDADCYWNEEDENGYEEGCKEIHYPPCLSECPGIADLEDPSINADIFCDYLIDIVPTCSNACDEEILSEIAYLNVVCTGCLNGDVAI